MPAKSVGAAAALVLTAALAVAGARAAQSPPAPVWNAAWSAAPQRPSTGFTPNWSEAGFSGQTLRQVVRVTTGGSRLRIRLSNAYGTSPLHIAGATVARRDHGARLRAGTVRQLTFGGSRAATVPAYGQLTSDPAGLPLRAFEPVTVTLHLDGTTGPATFHAQSMATSYAADGDHTADVADTAFRRTTQSWYYLSGVDVSGGDRPVRPGRTGGIVLFGDSITDGFKSTPDRDHRWSDALAERLATTGRPRPVLNAGIGGNLVLNDSAWYGQRSSARFTRDALDLPGVRTVVILEGVDDIGYSETDKPTYKPAPVVTAAQLIDGHRELIRQARARGIRVVGATLLPFGGSDHYGTRAAAVSLAFDQWVRTSGEYDAYVDFAKALADPHHPERLDPRYDSGDHLHPNDAGYRAMARAMDLSAL
ncbi:SGNH/GDSL hydrolase family protein [Streptantibioticus cattleyicolor]|uniref:Secreted protein n=1 Tax=Streptantibioticus cattleyicolor (strain ATCC 35852 / DSM 46488 / JCM 4925 / NBRC 14057 / NRRL 8057) TaxID=1003195 RepID=F8JNB8_STREN|nr:SGNH/GDSL hydrolase family protein [Streptantibioticus cattleyicolor]AEW99122.1 secreted protein [Streptantibioticus cattleyicolor NRRL 8057 = DSM 46488]CCB71835.1 putative secreted protein [Streptantibioticus cattleyicolor NRRL 8057 = DSM 46488]